MHVLARFLTCEFPFFLVLETTGLVCGVHLINEDFSISGQTAIVQVQGTGPTAALRISDFECRFDLGNYIPCT